MRSTGMQAWCVLTPSVPAPAPHHALHIALPCKCLSHNCALLHFPSGSSATAGCTPTDIVAY